MKRYLNDEKIEHNMGISNWWKNKSIWIGALIGAIILVTFIICMSPERPPFEEFRYQLTLALIGIVGALMGALIGFIIQKVRKK